MVPNAVVLRTARSLDAFAEHLRAPHAAEREHDVRDEEVARMSPLCHVDLDVLDRHTFRRARLDGALRPLRGPAAAGLDDGEDEAEDWPRARQPRRDLVRSGGGWRRNRRRA
ncbi:hypothetical protein [Streptomyces shenzhenensis]|uniref:hypothetical protein n=1 Tax=Streptomyces shenzhenensis TaxID=943815 RepID=UPI001C68E427|nr:hypothetical protein [Streptomyces shenzhenensis]